MWTPDGLFSDTALAATADEEQEMGALNDGALSVLGLQWNRTTSTTRAPAVQTTKRITLFRGPSLSTTPRFYFYNGRYWRLPQEWYAARRVTAFAWPRATTTTAAPTTTPTPDEDMYEDGGEEENNEAGRTDEV